MATNQHVTTEEQLEVVFSAVCAAAIATQWHSKHMSSATNQHSAIEEMLEMVFSMPFVPRGYNVGKFRAQFSCGICARW
jgi:hypothetical protein